MSNDINPIQRVPSTSEATNDEVKKLTSRLEEMEELKSKLQEALSLIAQINNKVICFDSVLNDEYLKNDIQESRLLKLEMEVMKLKDKR